MRDYVNGWKKHTQNITTHTIGTEKEQSIFCFVLSGMWQRSRDCNNNTQGWNAFNVFNI